MDFLVAENEKKSWKRKNYISESSLYIYCNTFYVNIEYIGIYSNVEGKKSEQNVPKSHFSKIPFKVQSYIHKGKPLKKKRWIREHAHT